LTIQLFRPRVSEDAIAAAAEVLRSGWLGLGPRTAEFEKAFAEYAGIQHCVGLSSCTAAIHLALHVLDLPRGAEVITTPLTFVSTNHAILYEGLTPVFADVNPATGSLNPESVRDRVTDRTGAIIVVHYGGYPADLDELYAIAREAGIELIEDCAHAAGASYKGRRIGSHGRLHAFSFHAVKNLPMGDGGALTVRDSQDDERLRRLRWLGIDKDTFRRTGKQGYSWEYDVVEVGYKCHMNDIDAAIGLVQLQLLDRDNARRASIAAQYRAGLANVAGLTLPPESSDRASSYHLFPVLAERRNDLADRLREAGIDTGVHYRRNDEYPMYRKSELPASEYFSTHTLSLPMHLDLSDDDVATVCRAIASGW
jgi:dTDP-4-amino-4,6-dideoxygalactose transaminase